MQIIGLTGGIASGKSTASKIFKDNGIPVLDCDAIVHDVQANDAILVRKLQRAFPSCFENGRIDRQKFSSEVLKSEDNLKFVENATLPFVREELFRLIEEHRSNNEKAVVIDAPLLFEKNLDEMCTQTICLYIPKEEQQKRYLQRPGATIEKFNAITKKQMSLEDKKSRADILILSDNMENLTNQINTTAVFLKGKKSTQNEQIGFYSGSFDPLTRGHWNLICDAICRCSQVYVGVGINPNKKPLFSSEERVDLIYKTIQDFIDSYQLREVNGFEFTASEVKAYKRLRENPNIVKAVAYSDLTVDAALRCGANVLLRGERNAKDHDYESEITTINQIIMKTRNQDLGYVTLTPTNQNAYNHISSSTAKALCGLGEYIGAEEFVTPSVHRAMMEKYLEKTFVETAKEFGINDENASRAEYTNLAKNYSQDRRYHTLTHVASCLNYLKVYESATGALPPEDKKSLVMAIFYHDVVQGESAEQLSGLKAKAFLEKGNDKQSAGQVVSLIDATKHLEKTKPLNHLQQIMSDLDLNVLGGQQSRYGNYKQFVRQDYAQVPEEAYGRGRIKVLGKLIAKDSLYHTAFFKEMFQEKVIQNLSNEKTSWKARFPGNLKSTPPSRPGKGNDTKN